MSFYLLLDNVLQSLQNLNPQALTPMHAHEGKVLRIQANDSPISMTLRVQDSQLVLADKQVTPHTTLSGKTVDLMFAFIKRDTGPHALMASNLSVEGDTGLLAAFHQTMQHLPPDFEAIVEDLTNDIVATELTRAVHKTWSSCKDFFSERLSDATQHMTYEKEWLVPKEAFDQFKQDIKALRRDVEQLQSRLITEMESADAN